MNSKNSYMKQINLAISSTFIMMRLTVPNDFESFVEWKLYDYISREFTSMRILATATPHKFN